jgi:hypothetical protein
LESEISQQREENRRLQDRIRARGAGAGEFECKAEGGRPFALSETADLRRHVEVMPGTTSIQLFNGQWRNGVRYNVDGVNSFPLPNDCQNQLKGSLKVRFDGFF